MNRFRTQALVAALVGLGACGRSEVFPQVDPPPPKTDVKPICGEVTPELGRATSSTGKPLRWHTDACIPVTYEPGLETEAAQLEAALAAWTAQSCTSLCFELPRLAMAGDPAYRLHLRLRGAGDEVPPSTIAFNSATYDDKTGGILFADLVIAPGAQLTPGDWLGQVGRAIGFNRAAPGTDSALESGAIGSSRTALGAIDLQSVCANYPVCK